MVMKLVRKKAPRSGLIRWLDEDEETALKNVSGRRISTGRDQYVLAEKILLEMRQREAWLQCDCAPGDSPAMNNANLMQDTGTLFWPGLTMSMRLTARCSVRSVVILVPHLLEPVKQPAASVSVTEVFCRLTTPKPGLSPRSVRSPWQVIVLAGLDVRVLRACCFR